MQCFLSTNTLGHASNMWRLLGERLIGCASLRAYADFRASWPSKIREMEKYNPVRNTNRELGINTTDAAMQNSGTKYRKFDGEMLDRDRTSTVRERRGGQKYNTDLGAKNRSLSVKDSWEKKQSAEVNEKGAFTPRNRSDRNLHPSSSNGENHYLERNNELTRTTAQHTSYTRRQSDRPIKVDRGALSNRFSGNLQGRRMHSEVRAVESSQPSNRDVFNADDFGNLSEASRVEMKQILTNIPDSDKEGEAAPFIRLSRDHRAHPPVWYERKMEKMIKRNEVNEAVAFLEHTVMSEDRVKPTAFMYNLLLAGIGRNGNIKEAFRLYNKMKKMGLHATDRTYTSLFNACANCEHKKDGLEQALTLLGLMREKSETISHITYKAAVKAVGVCGDLELAFSLVDESAKLYKVDDEIFSSLLMSCCSDKVSGFGLAIRVWREMRKRNVTLLIHHYNLLLRSACYCGVGDMASLRELIQVQEKSTVLDNPGTEVANTPLSLSAVNVSCDYSNTSAVESSLVAHIPDILNAKLKIPANVSLGNIRSPADSLMLLGGVNGILRRMDAHKCAPDIKTFAFLLRALPSQSDLEEELITIMKNREVKPDSHFYKNLIWRRSSRGDYQAMWNALSSLLNAGVLPSQGMFPALAADCASIDKAEQLLTQMKELGFHPHLHVFSSLASHCHFTDIEFMTFILASMNQHRVKPDKDFLDTVRSKFLRSKEQLVAQEKGVSVAFDHLIDSGVLRQYHQTFSDWLDGDSATEQHRAQTIL